jgi:sugar phosphate isomerase/epimerase
MIKSKSMYRLRFIALILLIVAFGSQGPARANQGGGKTFQDSLAVQLWSFREDFKKDVPGTLKRVRALGFTNVELAGYYGMTAEQFRKALDRAGLHAVSMHVEYEDARGHIDQVIREAKLLGAQYVGVPWIKSPFTREDCLAAIEVFNAAGQKLSASGLKFFYHLHGYEFVPDKGGQGTLFDLLMAKTDPRFVSIQLDTFHAVYPGQDPVKLMEKYPGRFSSLHMKDIRKEVVGDDSGDFKDADGRPMGQGKIDWPAVLKEARKEGVQLYIIEDETTAVWQGISASLKYLQTIKF